MQSEYLIHEGFPQKADGRANFTSTLNLVGEKDITGTVMDIKTSTGIFSKETGIVVVSGAKGGSGCSFISNSIAAWFARFKSKNVVLLDLNSGKKDTRIIFNIKDEVIRDLGDVACSFKDIDLSILKKLVINTESSLNIILPPLKFEKMELLQPENVHDLLDVLMRVFDLVIIDFPYHLLQLKGFDFLEYSDKFILVSQADYISISNLDVLCNNLFVENSPSRVEIIINKYNVKPVISPARIMNMLKFPVSAFIPYDNDIEFLYLTRGPFSMFNYNLRIVKVISDFAENIYASLFQE